MKIKNNNEFFIKENLTVVTDNGWILYFNAGDFDVKLGPTDVGKFKQSDLLIKDIIIENGVDVIRLHWLGDNKIKLREIIKKDKSWKYWK